MEKSSFRERRGQRLSPRDIRRFSHRLIAELESLLPGCRCRATPIINEDDGKAFVAPLIHRGRELGNLWLTFPAGALTPEMEAVLPSLIKIALDNMLLRKALLIDGETGLYSREHFRRRLCRAVRKRPGEGEARVLSMNDESLPELMLVMAELRQAANREEPGAALAAFAERFAAHINMSCPARLSHSRFCFLTEGRPEETRLKIESVLDEQLAARPLSRPVAAWAGYPRSLSPTEDAESSTRAGLRRRAAAFMDKANSALFYARQFRGPSLALAFGDIIRHHGQVVQLLPLDRVVINLGPSVGAAAGQIYMVEQPRREGEAVRYKGEITILEAAEGYSVAVISNRGEGPRIAAGDRLSFSRLNWNPEEREAVGSASGFSGARPASGPRQAARGFSAPRPAAPGFSSQQSVAPGFSSQQPVAPGFSSQQPVAPGFSSQQPVAPGFINSLDKREALLAKVGQWPADKPIQAALARLDAFDKRLAMLGREESERLLGFLFEKVARAFPVAAVGRWRTEMLALFWPAASQAEIKPQAHRLVSELMKAGPISMGLVFDRPHRGRPADLLDDAKKALNEASFYGHGQVTVFGPLALNIEGDQLFEGGDFSGALAEYARGLALAPDNVNLLNSLGVSYGRLGKFHESLAAFKKILKAEPDNMMAHYNLGYTHILSGRMEEAEEALSRAAELDPDNFEALFHLGKTALELGRLDKALPALSKAASLSAARPAIFRLLGQALLLTHDTRGALQAFKKAVKADPNDAYSLSSLGTLFAELADDLEVAKSLFQKSVEIDPTNSLYRQRLGRLLFKLGDFKGAAHHLNMAKEYGGRAPELYYQLGSLAEEEGRAEEAAALFRAALAQDPAYQPALLKLQNA